jgi:ribosomal protein S6
MARYELLFITTPEITSDEAQDLQQHIERLVAEHQAELISYERWGKYRLAYPIRSYDYGVYFLSRFEIPTQQVKAFLDNLQRSLAVKYNELVMRSLVSRLQPHASLAYHRPESLEETPARDVETFLKENKMTGLMGGRRSAHKRDEELHDQEGR